MITSKAIRNYCIYNKIRWKKYECIIAKSCSCSLYYAKDVIKGRWELAEKTIAQHPIYSYCYAINVLKNRFLLGENSIAQNDDYKQIYEKHFNCKL
jgi:hypothetical protein